VAAILQRPRLVIGCSTALTATWLATATTVHRNGRLVLTVLALLGWGAVLAVWRRDGKLPVGLCWAAGLLLVGVAAARSPIGSRDLWSYVMQGRIVAVHHGSPYVRRPADFPLDPFLRDTALGWSHDRSPYGPLFTVISASGAWVARGSELANRLVHQGLAAVAVIAVAVMHERRRPSGGAVAFLVLSPVTLAIVNGGHNDLLVGGLIAGAVLLLDRRRVVQAGMCLAAAALIKIVALLPAAAAVIWLWRRAGARAAATLAGTIGILCVGAYWLAGGVATLRIVLNAGARTSRASLWQLVGATELSEEFRHPAKAWALGGLAAVLVLVVLVLRRWSGERSSRKVVVASTLAFLLAWPFVMPWYVGWSMPTSSGDPESLPSVWTAIFGSAILLAYVVRPGVAPTGANAFVSGVAYSGAVVAMLLVAARRSRAYRERIDVSDTSEQAS
jgi:alpha-1,6-mannosyltransferase